MALDVPHDTDPLPHEWIAPLQLVAATQAGERLAHFLDVDDFMVMGRIVRPPRPTIVLYKHAYTRSYLNLDADGQAYRYIPTRRSSHGRYDRQPLDEALRQVGLDQLPWLKPGLEGEQRGLRWEDRVILRRTLDREYTARGRPPPEIRFPTRRRPRATTLHRDEPATVVGAEGGARRGHLHVV